MSLKALNAYLRQGSSLSALCDDIGNNRLSFITGVLRMCRSTLGPVEIIESVVESHCKEVVSLYYLTNENSGYLLSFSSIPLQSNKLQHCLGLVTVFQIKEEVIEQFSRIQSKIQDKWNLRALVLQKKGLCASVIYNNTVWELTLSSGCHELSGWDAVATACIELGMAPVIALYDVVQTCISDLCVTEHLRQALVELKEKRGTEPNYSTYLSNILCRHRLTQPESATIPACNSDESLIRLTATKDSTLGTHQLSEHQANLPAWDTPVKTEQREPCRPPPIEVLSGSALSRVSSQASSSFLHHSHALQEMDQLQIKTLSLQDNTLTPQTAVQHSVQLPNVQFVSGVPSEELPMRSTAFFPIPELPDSTPAQASDVEQLSLVSFGKRSVVEANDSEELLKMSHLQTKWNCSRCAFPNMFFTYKCKQCNSIDSAKQVQLVEHE